MCMNDNVGLVALVGGRDGMGGVGVGFGERVWWAVCWEHWWDIALVGGIGWEMGGWGGRVCMADLWEIYMGEKWVFTN